MVMKRYIRYALTAVALLVAFLVGVGAGASGSEPSEPRNATAEMVTETVTETVTEPAEVVTEVQTIEDTEEVDRLEKVVASRDDTIAKRNKRIEQLKAQISAQGPITTERENALQTAKDYLDYSSFSKSGLVEQLEYEGYSNADAWWAVGKVYK